MNSHSHNDLLRSEVTEGDEKTKKSFRMMRAKLKFHFLSPVEKWKVTKQLPYKLIIQILKIMMVTIQLVMFCYIRLQTSDYIWDNKVVLSRTFVKGLYGSSEVDSYPPSFGSLAVFSKQLVYEYINHAANTYGNLDEHTLGTYMHERNETTDVIQPILFCVEKMLHGHIWDHNSSYSFNDHFHTVCINIDYEDINNSNGSFDSESWLNENNFTMNFIALHTATLSFPLKTINVHSAIKYGSSECYRFYFNLEFDNSKHSGRILITPDVNEDQFDCSGKFIASGPYYQQAALDTLNVAVIILCSTSFILCSRAVYRALLLKEETSRFFKQNFGEGLSSSDRFEFINLWYVMIIVNDVLIIVGSSIRLGIFYESYLTNWCSVLLGTGNLLVWLGVLRYLGFLSKYNVVMLTLKKSSPNLLRFLICALIIYAGFTFCGWLVLGPYHYKFRDLMTTSETLFSLINGDDMFATYASMSTSSVLLWWFSRLYLYIFISLFIYVVLSLFIAVIMDAYETIKDMTEPETEVGRLQSFINGDPTVSCAEDRDSERSGLWHVLTSSLRLSRSASETTPLLNNT